MLLSTNVNDNMIIGMIMFSLINPISRVDLRELWSCSWLGNDRRNWRTQDNQQGLHSQCVHEQSSKCLQGRDHQQVKVKELVNLSAQRHRLVARSIVLESVIVLATRTQPSETARLSVALTKLTCHCFGTATKKISDRIQACVVGLACMKDLDRHHQQKSRIWATCSAPSISVHLQSATYHHHGLQNQQHGVLQLQQSSRLTFGLHVEHADQKLLFWIAKQIQKKEIPRGA